MGTVSAGLESRGMRRGRKMRMDRRRDGETEFRETGTKKNGSRSETEKRGGGRREERAKPGAHSNVSLARIVRASSRLGKKASFNV